MKTTQPANPISTFKRRIQFEKIPLWLLAALATTMVLPGCFKSDPAASTSTPTAASAPAKAATKAASVRVETVKSALWVQRFAVTGSVEAGRIAQLSSMAEGPVLSVRVREGDQVKRGQVLVTLGRTEAVSSLAESLREDLRHEEDNLARTRRLTDLGALPGEQVDTAAANVTRIRSQLARTQESIRDYVITAPWAGMVSKMRVRDGDVAGPRTPLVEMIDPTSLLVRVAVPEAHSARLPLGMKADIELDAYPQQTFAALVTRIYPTLDARTHTRLAELALIEHPVLLPGMFARVSLVRESVPDVITVPSHSLLATPGGGAAVMLVVDGKAVRSKVQIGIDADGRTRITEGLKPGNLLIVAGQETLKDGALVQVVTTPGKNGTAKVDKPEVASSTSQNSTSPAKVKP